MEVKLRDRHVVGGGAAWSLMQPSEGAMGGRSAGRLWDNTMRRSHSGFMRVSVHASTRM